jgi:hypothetical protein
MYGSPNAIGYLKTKNLSYLGCGVVDASALKYAKLTCCAKFLDHEDEAEARL